MNPGDEACFDMRYGGTSILFCSRIHFGRMLPGGTERYIRFAYSGINTADIQEGIARFKNWIES